MLRIFAVVTFLSFFVPSYSSILLSDSSKISMLTCAPGQELYSLYGHSALRVKDDKNAIDLVFNYGTFDFNTPNFYLKFANGNLKYMLAVGHFNRFLNSYFKDNRNVWEQELNLTSEERQRLFEALVTNAKEENRYYRYDFFFDNCATRIRDIVYDNLDGQVSYLDTAATLHSFRSYIHEYEEQMPWIKDGLDIILGYKTDDIASVYQQMFLPDYLMLYFNKAVIKKDGEENRSLIKEIKPLLKFEPEAQEDILITPKLFFWLVLLISLIILTYEIKINKRPIIVFNRLLFLITGIVGLLIVFLWFFTRHGVTGDNFNLLWAHPLYLLPAFLPVRLLRKGWYKPLLLTTILGLLIMSLLWFIIPQNIPSMVFPIVLLLLIRTAYLYHYLYK